MKPAIQRLGTLSFLLPAGVGVVSVIYLSQCLKINIGTLDLPEEGFVPLIFGALLLGGSCVLMVDALLKPQETSAPPTKTEIHKLLLLIGVIFAYIIVLPVLGFSLTTFLMFVSSSKIMGARLKSAIVMGLCVIIVCYMIFILWLNVPLPKTILY